MIWGKLIGAEKIYVIFIITTAMYVIISRLYSKNIHAIWSPNTMMFTAILYYAIAGPLISIYNDDFFLRLINHREYYELAWQGLSLFIIVYLFGYNISNYKRSVEVDIDPKNINVPFLKKQLFRLFGLGLFTVFLLKGTGLFSSLTFWETNNDIEQIYSGGSLIGYLFNGMNLLIAAVPMLVYCWRKHLMPKWLCWGLLFVCFAVFSAEGFRWRLVIAGFTGLGMYYMSKGMKVKVLPVILLGISFIAYMGILEVSRSYGKGLDLSLSEQNTFSDNLLLGFNESAVFQATGLVMDKTGEKFDYIGFKPIIESIATPIPRALWPSKPTGSYISNITDAYSIGGRKLGLGQAVLNYGEYYMAYGFIGIVLYGLGLGLLLGWLEKIALRQMNNPWVVCFYLLNAGYVYVIFSRGYMPQQFMFYFFTVFPAWFLYKRSLKNNAVH